MVFSYVRSLPISRILFLCRHVSRAEVACSLKRHSRNKTGTVLHTRMYLAVSAGLNRIVSVRNTVVAHDGNYPLRLLIQKLCVRTFLTSKLAHLPGKEHNNYTIITRNFKSCYNRYTYDSKKLGNPCLFFYHLTPSRYFSRPYFGTSSRGRSHA